MNVDLAPVIADFFSAEERRDTEALARCFADDAVVRDEGRRWPEDRVGVVAELVARVGNAARGSRFRHKF